MISLSSSSCCIWVLLFLNLYLKILQAHSSAMSFSFENFGKDSNFTSHLVLQGDAKVSDESMSIIMAGSGISSAGRIVLRKPISFLGRNSSLVSFSMRFTFSVSRGNADGFAFIIAPVSSSALQVFDVGSVRSLQGNTLQSLAVKFVPLPHETSRLSVEVVSNVSSAHMEIINSGEKMRAWIDYEAGSKQLDVRLSKSDAKKPLEPLLCYQTDLSNMLKQREEAAGVQLSSLSRNSSVMCNVYSMSFESRWVPHWLHSRPMDLEAGGVHKGKEVAVAKRSDDNAHRILVVLLSFGIGCGALLALLVLFLWTIFCSSRLNTVAPEACPMGSKQCECEDSVSDKDKSMEGVNDVIR